MSVGPTTTVEGVERGNFLVGSLDKRGVKRLLYVTKVVGKHQVEAETHVGDALVTIKIRTNSLHRENSRLKRVKFVPVTEGEGVGVMIQGSEPE